MPVTRTHFRYEKVAEDLRRQVSSGQLTPGDQLPTENALAEQYEINRQTVRRALSLLADEGIIVREKGRGTFVTEPDVAEAGTSLLYVGQYNTHLYQTFYASLCREGQKAGIWVNALDPNGVGGQDEALTPVTGHLEMGSALLCDASAWKKLRGHLPEDTIPDVLIYTSGEAGEEPTFHVRLDRRAAIRKATQHLADLGHRRIAYLGTHPEHPDDDMLPCPLAASETYVGFRSVLLERELEEVAALAYYTTEEAVDHLSADVREKVWCPTERDAEELIERFLTEKASDATAFVCDADFRAVTLRHVLARRGVDVPGEVSLLGVGNTPWSEAVRPKLTTVSLDEEALAALALQCAQNGPARRPVAYSVSPAIVERNSTGQPPHKNT
ncbi:MAG: GntR family transcriptional regulator [Candidatus Brocadiia bacterium]